MVRIFLPAMGAFEDDVKTMRDLLDSTVNRYLVGLDIIGKPDHFTEEENLDKIRRNLESLSNTEIWIHGFSGLAVYTEGIANLGKRRGRQLLETYVDLAKFVNATYVHTHSGAGYIGETNDSAKKDQLLKIKNNLVAVAKKLEDANGSRITLGIENLPCPSMGDMETDPDKVWKDYVDSVEDVLHTIRGTSVKATFDTCHYGCDKNGKNFDIVEPVKEIGSYLGALHVGDVKGYWSPYKSTWEEGVIPGEGRIGKDSFRNFFRYIRDEHPDIGIVVEVTNQDFKNPIESKEAIKKIMNWIES